MTRKILYMAVLSCLMAAACSKAVPEGFKVNDPESYSKIYLGTAFHGNANVTLLPGKDTVLNVYANYGGIVDLDVPVSVTFEVDTSLVSQYNKLMQTSYVPLPMSNSLLEHRTVTIEAGHSASDPMKLHITSENLQKKGPFMLPVTIKGISGKDYPVSDDLKTLYVIVNFDDSSVEYPYYDRTAWDVSEGENASCEALLDGDRYTFCDCTQEHEHCLILDMKRPVWVHGLAFTSRIRLLNGAEYHYAGQPRTIKVEVSKDGKDWEVALSQGTVPFGIETEIRVSDYVKARYIRLTVSKTWITKNYVGAQLSFSEINVF